MHGCQSQVSALHCSTSKGIFPIIYITNILPLFQVHINHENAISSNYFPLFKMTFSVLTEVDLWHVDKKQNLRCYNVQYGSYYYYYYVSVVSNMPFLLHLSSFVLSRWKPICMGLYLAPCHIVGIQWLTLWNWLKTGGPETKRVDLSFLICPTCLSCDDVMKHRKWLGRSPSPPFRPHLRVGSRRWETKCGRSRRSWRNCKPGATAPPRYRRVWPSFAGSSDTSEGPDLLGAVFHF